MFGILSEGLITKAEIVQLDCTSSFTRRSAFSHKPRYGWLMCCRVKDHIGTQSERTTYETEHTPPRCDIVIVTGLNLDFFLAIGPPIKRAGFFLESGRSLIRVTYVLESSHHTEVCGRPCRVPPLFNHTGCVIAWSPYPITKKTTKNNLKTLTDEDFLSWNGEKWKFTARRNVRMKTNNRV